MAPDFLALAACCPDILVCYDREGRRKYVNPAYEKLLGVPVGELTGRRIPEVSALPPDLAAVAESLVLGVAAGGPPQDKIFTWRQPGGGEFSFHLHLVPEQDGNGETVGVLAFARDITDYRRIEMELRAREAEFRALAENSPDSIVRYDTECRRIYVNPAYERLSGIPVARALLKTPLELSYLPPAEAAAYQQRLLAVMASGKPANLELDWKRSDGRRGLQHVVAVPERNPDGQVVSILTVARDISDLKEVQGRLEEAEAKARLGYWQWDRQAGKAVLSAEVCRIFGKPREWSPSEAEVLECVVAEEQDWIKATLSVALASQSPDVSLEFRIQGEDRARDVHSSIRIEYGEDGEPALLVGTIQDISEMKSYEQRVHALANYDALTGLPNRELFADHLREAASSALGRGCELAVLMVDLDNFKGVNDTFGHDSGDQILRETAARLRRCIRESDVVARLGGDEFGFVLTDLRPDADFEGTCRRIRDAVGEAFPIAGREVFLTCSIGIARYPADTRDVSSLLQYADAAMYHAKEEGRDNHQFYAASLTRRITQRLNLAAKLRRAEANGELELYYQPQVDLATGELLGAEALLRWNHPEEGLVTPDRFIPIAEEMGFIISIGAWVLRNACEAAKSWNQGREKPLKVAVNLSPRQFKVNDLVATVTNVLAETGCAPAWLELEITESLLVEDAVDVGHILEAFHGMGVSISIDDFGTGYSALSYLNRFRVDAIKIDRSFVRDIGARSDGAELVKAIIAMAHSLHLELVAEGIEEKGQELFLRQHGCRVGQGYLYGRPMPIREFEALLASRPIPSAA
ncbi:MAG TPA: EAL domain-containing protein [Rhodocyclaceae bacterium]|nr:EAL domain-containing protein [Rhodocyclaceae bacterium]